jgi:putative flippase GtrA
MKLAGEGLRFLLGGVVNTLASYGIYLALQFFLPYQAAYAIAFALGVAISYYINLVFVFRQRGSARKALVFPFVYLAQYLLGAATLALLVERLGVAKEYAPLLVVIVTIPVTFALSRRVLRGKPSA